MTPEQSAQAIAQLQRSAAVDRAIVLVEHYASEARKAKALSHAALQAARAAPGLVLANDAGQQVSGDEKAAAGQAAQAFQGLAQDSINNLLFACQQLIGLTVGPPG